MPDAWETSHADGHSHAPTHQAPRLTVNVVMLIYFALGATIVKINCPLILKIRYELHMIIAEHFFVIAIEIRAMVSVA